MPREMRLPRDLQPEQLEVLIQATVPNPNEMIFVQGVAGSGKTTIALNIALKVGELNAGRQPDNRQTILFLTYNDRLAEYCRNTLLNFPTITGIVAKNNSQLEDGHINVLTVSDLFRFSICMQGRDKFLTDDDCVRYITNIAAQRGILDLLPTQIFSLIATFLRGRPELFGKTIEELNETIDKDMVRSVHYRMYGVSLQEIRRRLITTYEDWKRKNKGLDRSDVAGQLRNQILKIEGHLTVLPNLDAEYLRKISRRRLGDTDLNIYPALEWSKELFEIVQNIPSFEQKSRSFLSILEGKRINQDEVKELCDAIFEFIPKIGLRATNEWETICTHLKNPLVIVDEIQDLSPVECENLASLWFQLARTHDSHLILLGDLNQQITPSGFEWGTLHKLIEKKAIIYHRDIAKPYTPDLNNNYRTTEEIARFVHCVISIVAPKALKDEEIAQRFLKYSINPDNTLPISLQEKIDQVKREGGDLIPHVLVGSNKLFREGLNKYVETLKAQEDPGDLNDKILSTVIITEHGTDIDDLISKELSKYVLDNDLIEIIPVLSCKGLEFDRCVLHGLSVKKLGEIEQDLVSRWYTSFTRAKLQLLIYLTEQEYEFIQKLGWNEIPADVVLVKKVTMVDDIVKELEQLGKTDLDDDVRYSIGEASLARFFRTGSEDYLQKSLRLLKGIELHEKYLQVAAQGADWFEKQKNYIKSADYYHEADSAVDEVRCLALHANFLNGEGVSSQEVYQRSRNVTENTADIKKQAKCWIYLQEYADALDVSSKSSDKNFQQEIVSQVADAIKLLVNDQPDNATFYAELLEENEYWWASALSWLNLSNWDRAFQCAAHLEKNEMDTFAQQAAKVAEELVKKDKAGAKAISIKLDENKYFEFSSQIWLQLHDVPSAIQSMVNFGAVDNAENIVRKPEYKTNDEQKKQIYSILAKGFHRETKKWPRAYEYFYLANLEPECRRLEQECRVREDYRTLANCFSEIRDFKKVIELANELELKGFEQKELIAECWQKSEEWERAANAWMGLFFEHIERSEEFFGPSPDRKDPHPSSKSRFYRNIENNLTNYQLLLTDWENLSKFTSSPRQFYENTAKVVEIISKSEQWQAEATKFIKTLRERARNASVGFTDSSVRVKLPEKIKPLTTSDVADYWEKITIANAIFQHRAVEVSRECYKKADKLLAVRLMYGVCTWRDEAAKMSDELAETDIDLWIKSWKMLEYSNDLIERKIFSLNHTSQPDVIRQAIFETYQDNEIRRKTLWDKYRDKLVTLNSRKSQDLLKKYFPEYKPPQLEPTLQPGQSKFTWLIKDLSDVSSKWSLHTGDRIELTEQLKSMPDMLEKPDRLVAKWKMVKSLLPEDLDEQSRANVDQLEELINKTKDGSNQLLENLPLVPEIEEQAATTPTKTRSRQRHRNKQARQQKALQFVELDLHDFSLPDAERTFEATFETYDYDKKVGGILVIHGHGKGKNVPVIKEWLDNRFNRLRHHKSVRQIIKGEEIADAYCDKATLIRSAVDNFDFTTNVNNPGISVIIFNRS